MDENQGYQVLAMLLRKKIHLLNVHILHLVFTLVGTLDATKDVVGVPNIPAFRDILCDLDLWHAAPVDLEKSLFEHFSELVSDSKKSFETIKLMRDFGVIEKLLSILKQMESTSNPSIQTLLKVVHGLLCTSPRVSDVLCFALFTAAQVNEAEQDEKLHDLKLNEDGTDILEGPIEKPEMMENVKKSPNPNRSKTIIDKIVLRNRCLKLFHSLLYHVDDIEIHANYCEDVAQVVGFDWVLLFLQGHLHPSTVVWGLRILMTLVSLPQLMIKFRSGSCNGHWLLKSENVLHNKMIDALGQGQATNTRVSQNNIRRDIFQVPGFQQLNWLMPSHTEISDAYFLLAGILLGRTVKEGPLKAKRLDLDAVWEYVFGCKASDVSNQVETFGKINVCGDAAMTILVMVRKLLNSSTEQPDWLHDYPMMLTQFLFYLYHNVSDFMPAFNVPEVLTSLVGSLFPCHVDDTTEQRIFSQDGDSSASATDGKHIFFK